MRAPWRMLALTRRTPSHRWPVALACALLVFGGNAQAQPAEEMNRASSLVPSRHTDADEEEGWGRLTFAPTAPTTRVEASLATSLVPSFEQWMGDVDVELPRRLAFGFRGVYGRCNPCNRRDVGLEDIREGIARVHAMYSRPNFAGGGTLLFARGADLEGSAFSAKPGFGTQLRLGRVEGLRMDTGVGVLVDRQLALAFHWAVYVPVFAWRFERTVLRVLLESRAEILIPHPTLLLVTAGMRVRVGPVLVGLRGAVFEEDLSLMLVVGVVVGREG